MFIRIHAAIILCVSLYAREVHFDPSQIVKLLHIKNVHVSVQYEEP